MNSDRRNTQRQSAASQPPSIELHIEELVLHGFPESDRHRIAAAVQQELSRMFAGSAVPATLAQGGEVDRIKGRDFTASSGATGEAIGAQIAQSVYGGITK